MDLNQTAERLKLNKEKLESTKFLIGFDGMVDEIIHVVNKRESKDEYSRIRTIKEFGNRILSAQGKSANIELVTVIKKLGGNAPLMSMAVSGMGANVTCMGILGYPEIKKEFQAIKERCEVVSIAEPGLTDALEFDDGKLMYGKLEKIHEMCWENICSRLGEDKFKKLLLESDFVACTNWTMLTEFEEIIDNIIRIVPDNSNTTYFFDIADPEKRKPEELLRLLEQMKKLNQKGKSLLGLNLREAEQIMDLLGVSVEFEDNEKGLKHISGEIKNSLNIHGVVVHSVGFAGADIGNESAGVEGPYTPKPKITTGAGDHFNGGFASALASGLSVEDSLNIGVATSGWYVRNGGPSPRIDDVVGLLKDWGKGELENH